MPNLLQTYSLNSGLKIRKCKPQELFCPVPEKYITLQTSSGMEAKNYDYWLDVVEYIKDPLAAAGYTILHIGTEGSQLPYVENFIGKTSIPQINYVIRNSKLHLGNDSFAVHLAGVHDRPAVALYGPTSASNHGPHFGKNHKLIESHRNGNKPSFASHEDEKTINFIKPEEVANKVFEALDMEDRITEETIFVGPQYGKHYIEIIPDTVVNPQALQGQIPTIRCDYHYNEEKLAQNLSQTRCSVITDQETNLDLYKQLRHNIQNINFKVSMTTDLDYIKKLRNIGVEVRLWFDDPTDRNDILFRFLDIEQPHFVEYKSFDVEIPEGAKYRGFKYLLSDGKIYISKSAWIEGREISSPSDNSMEIVDKGEVFRNEMEYFKIVVDR